VRHATRARSYRPTLFELESTRSMIARLIGVFFMAFLAACAPMRVEQFSGKGEPFDLFAYFDGQTKAYGLFEDRFGKVRRQFVVDIKGTIEDNVITLDEDFVYDDGEEQNRVWTITKTSSGTYEGRAGDIIGTAKGVESGNALNWSYDMTLSIGGRDVQVHFDDWMFRQADNVVLNRAKVTKFGIELGTVTLAFVKP